MSGVQAQQSADRLQTQPLGRLVAMAGHLASERWTRYLSDAYGLSPAGAAVLMTLDRPRRLTHGELADACYIAVVAMPNEIPHARRVEPVHIAS